MNFIKTDNGDTATTLIGLGFAVIDCSNGIWTFLNEDNKKLNFAKIDKKHLVFTDVLSI